MADQFYLKALKGNLEYFRIAKYLFPFEKEILIGEAEAYIKYQIVSPEGMLVLKDALKYDPYSPQKLSLYMQYSNLFGNKNEVIMTKQKLNKIVPNSNMMKILTAKGH